MKFDFTGILDDGGFVTLSPGRYNVVTKPEWSAGQSKSGNLSLRIPFTVLDKGEFEGATSSYFHTIMLDGPADKLRTNKVFTLRLLTALRILSEADRGPKGELEVEFEYGARDENDRAPVHSIIVNRERRGLGDRYGIAVVVLSDNSSTGVSVKTIEPAANGAGSGKPQSTAAPAAGAMSQPSVGGSSKKGFPF